MITSKNKIIGGNAKLVRNINKSAILNIIREKQPISRISISKITKLNKSTVSSIVSELIHEKYLIEEMVADSNVGRNPIQLRINSSSYHVGAVNFDTKMIKVAIVNIAGNVICELETHPSGNSAEEYVKLAIKTLKQLQKDSSIKKLEGIGVTISGLIDHFNGNVIVAPNLGWNDVKLGELFKQHIQDEIELHFENDAKASALAELWFGKGMIDNFSNFVFTSIGSGVGTGIVIDRKVIEGVSYAAGEFGHMNIFAGGESCVCGNRGCWEAYASDRATVKRYIFKKGLQKVNIEKIKIKDVITAAQKQEKEAMEVLKETARFIGIGISNIILSLDPSAVVISGNIVKAWELIFPEIIDSLKNCNFFGLEKRITILPSSLSAKPRLIGAATLVLERIFNDYKITK